MPARPRRSALGAVVVVLGVLVASLVVLATRSASAGVEEPPVPAAPLTVAGTVTGPDGPVEGAAVTVLARTLDGWTTLGPFPTGPDGGYRSFAVPRDLWAFLGADALRVSFVARGLVPEFHADQPELVLADDLPMTGTGELRVDAHLEAGPLRLAGRLTAEGAPVHGAPVWVWRQDSEQEWQFYNEEWTGASGAWQVPAAPGRYRVRLGLAGESLDYVPDPDDGDREIEMTTSSREGLDLDVEGGVVQGRVTTDGVPTRAQVSLYDSDEVDGQTSCRHAGGAANDPRSGHYAVVGLPEGRYHVRVDPSPVEYYDPWTGCSAPSVEIEVRGGVVTTYDLDLGPSASPSPFRWPRPVLLGSGRVGTTLMGLVLPRPGWSVSRQWLRDGEAIPRATRLFYRVTRRDRGTTLSLRATYRRGAGAPFVLVSAGRKVR